MKLRGAGSLCPFKHLAIKQIQTIKFAMHFHLCMKRKKDKTQNSISAPVLELVSSGNQIFAYDLSLVQAAILVKGQNKYGNRNK